MTRAALLLICACATAPVVTSAQSREEARADSIRSALRDQPVIVEADSTALHLLGVELRSVEARRMALAARGSAAWMLFNEAGAALHAARHGNQLGDVETDVSFPLANPDSRRAMADSAASLVDSLSSGMARRDRVSTWGSGSDPSHAAAAPGDSLTLALSFHEPQSEPPTVWLMPLDAALDTLLRVAGANAAAWIPPEAVAWFALRDSVVYLTIPNWGPTLVFAIAWRLSNPAMGESVGPPLPQLTAGRVGSSPQIPLVARFDTSTTPDSSVVILRFDPFAWKEPCYREGGCE